PVAVRGEQPLPHAVDGHVVVPRGDHHGGLAEVAQHLAREPVLARLRALRQVPCDDHEVGGDLLGGPYERFRGPRPIRLADLKIRRVQDGQRRATARETPAAAGRWRDVRAIPAIPTPTMISEMTWASVSGPMNRSSFARRNSTRKRSMPASASQSMKIQPGTCGFRRSRHSRKKINVLIPAS